MTSDASLRGSDQMSRGDRDSDMLAAVLALPDQLRRAAVQPPVALDSASYTNLVVLGMGGSGISGDVAAAVLGEECALPIVVVKEGRVPAFVGKGSLVVAASYSGNTAETLAGCAESMRRGAEVACVCSGGDLLDLAQKNGFPLVTVPGGMQPRAAIGYLAVATSSLLAAAAEISITEQVREAIEILDGLAAEMAPGASETDNSAMALARRMIGKVPVVYGGSRVAAVAANRWKCQLNENSKVPAFRNEYPEMGHNEIVGWSEGNPLRSAALLVALRDRGAENPGFDVALDISREGAAGLVEISSQGVTALARFFSLAYFGDFVSVYLALARGIDPTPVEAIGRLKSRQ